MQFGVEDRRSSRHGCRHYSVRGSRRTTYGNTLPTLLRETPFALSVFRVACHPKPVRAKGGGEGGIRTPDRLAPMPHFECGAFDHSATSPGAMTGDSHPRSGRVLGEDGGPDKAPRPRFPARAKREKGAQKWSI